MTAESIIAATTVAVSHAHKPTKKAPSDVCTGETKEGECRARAGDLSDQDCHEVNTKDFRTASSSLPYCRGGAVNPAGPVQKVVAGLDGWQRRTRWAGVSYGVVKKFSDDNANLLVVSLAWYAFTAIFPLLLVLVTVLGFIGQRSISSSVISTLHEFPVVGSSFKPASRSVLPGSPLGLVIGLIGLVYGAQGVTQTAQQAMATVWNIPQTQRTGFLPRLGRSLAGLLTIGGAFVLNAFVTGYATTGGSGYLVRVPLLVGLLLVNIGLYFASFVLLTAKTVPLRRMLPGAILGAVALGW